MSLGIPPRLQRVLWSHPLALRAGWLLLLLVVSACNGPDGGGDGGGAPPGY